MISYTPRGAAYPKQRPHSEIGHTNGMDTNVELKKILKKEGIEKLEPPSTKEQPIEDKEKGTADVKKLEGGAEGDATNVQKTAELKRLPKPVPKLDNIVDCLHFKVHVYM